MGSLSGSGRVNDVLSSSSSEVKSPMSATFRSGPIYNNDYRISPFLIHLEESKSSGVSETLTENPFVDMKSSEIDRIPDPESFFNDDISFVESDHSSRPENSNNEFSFKTSDSSFSLLLQDTSSIKCSSSERFEMDEFNKYLLNTVSPIRNTEFAKKINSSFQGATSDLNNRTETNNIMLSVSTIQAESLVTSEGNSQALLGDPSPLIKGIQQTLSYPENLPEQTHEICSTRNQQERKSNPTKIKAMMNELNKKWFMNRPEAKTCIKLKTASKSVTKGKRPSDPDFGDYRAPARKKPKPYVTSAMYKFLEGKLNHFGLGARLKAEEFVIFMCSQVETVIRRKTGYHRLVNELLKEMVKLKLVKSRFDFHIFIETYLPYEFRQKAIPCFGCDLGPSISTRDLYNNMSQEQIYDFNSDTENVLS